MLSVAEILLTKKDQIVRWLSSRWCVCKHELLEQNAEVTVRSAPVWHLLCGSHGGLEERDRKQFPSLNFYLELGEACTQWHQHLSSEPHAWDVVSEPISSCRWPTCKSCLSPVHLSIGAEYVILLHIPVPSEAVQTDRAQLQDYRLLRSPNIPHMFPGLSQVFSPVIWNFSLL